MLTMRPLDKRGAWAAKSKKEYDLDENGERIRLPSGIDEIPTVHMGVAACQMEKKGIATEKGELNRNIQKVNLLIREIRAQIGKLKEWIKDAKSVTLASSNLPRRETTRGTIAYRKNRKLGKPSTHD